MLRRCIGKEEKTDDVFPFFLLSEKKRKIPSVGNILLLEKNILKACFLPEYIFGKRSNNVFHILATSGENVIGVLERIFLKREGKIDHSFYGKKERREKIPFRHHQRRRR